MIALNTDSETDGVYIQEDGGDDNSIYHFNIKFLQWETCKLYSARVCVCSFHS